MECELYLVGFNSFILNARVFVCHLALMLQEVSLFWRGKISQCVPQKAFVDLVYLAAIKFHLLHTLVFFIIDIFGGCWLMAASSLFLGNKEKFG